MDIGTKKGKKIAGNPIAQVANIAARELRKYDKDNRLPGDEWAKMLHLTRGQLSTVIAYMRECSIADYDKFINWYPLSSKKGYWFGTSIEEVIPCFRALYWWSTTLNKRISPLKEQIQKAGYDIHDVIFHIDPDEEHKYEDNYIDHFGEYSDYRIPDMAEKAWDK